MIFLFDRKQIRDEKNFSTHIIKSSKP